MAKARILTDSGPSIVEAIPAINGWRYVDWYC